MGNRYHPNKELHAAIAVAVGLGWEWTPNHGKNHIKGELKCPHHDRSGCVVRVRSTPRNPETHAKQVGRQVARCAHVAKGQREPGVTFGSGRFVKRVRTGRA